MTSASSYVMVVSKYHVYLRQAKTLRSILVAGNFHHLLCKYSLDIANHDALYLDSMLSFMQYTQLRYNQIVITDDGMVGGDNYTIVGILTNLLILIERENRRMPILLITNQAQLKELKMSGIDIQFYSKIRIPIDRYLEAIRKSNITVAVSEPERVQKKGPDITADKSVKKDKKPSLIERLKKDKTVIKQSYNYDDFAIFSKGFSRVLAITGYRGSGVTSTAVNLAQIANMRGLSTNLIDLDIENCTLNLYFSSYYELAKKDTDIAYSLIRNLAKPQNYDLNTYSKDNLYVTTLSYFFDDEELLENFYTATKFINMLAVFKKRFQLCLLDMPFEALAKLRECIMYIDDFGLCVSNNLYSITATLRNVQKLFTKDDLEALHSKSKIIVSKYNDQASLQGEFFSPEKVCELLLELKDVFYGSEFGLAGYIPYTTDFDSQLETDIPVVSTNAQLEKAFSDILLRLIKI